MHPCGREGRQHPEPYQEEKCQQVEGGDPFVLLRAGENTSGVPGPVRGVCNVLDWMTVVYLGVSEPPNS